MVHNLKGILLKFVIVLLYYQRKGFSALADTSGKANTSKGSTTEIIVESPGPVINPLPITPKDQRQPKLKKVEIHRYIQQS